MRCLSILMFLSFFSIYAEDYLISIPISESERTNFKTNHQSLDFASPIIGKTAELVVSQQEYDMLLKEGYKINIKARSSKQRRPDDFLTNEETWSLLDSISKAFPDLCQYDTVGYSQRYNKPIVSVKISDNVSIDEDEPGALFNGMVHAREPMGNAIIVYTIKWLLNNYNSNSKATNYVNNYQIYFAPIVNPDGWWYIYEYYQNSPWWRKNMRDNYTNGGNFSRNDDGVDLNRNFDWHWGNAGESSPSNWKYYGKGGNSESELKALDKIAARSRAIVGISYHSYGPYIMYPYSYNGKTTPDNGLIVDMAYKLTDQIGSWYQNPKRLGGAGQGSDFLYGKYGIIDFTVEAATNFIPSPTEINKEVSGNFRGICYLLDRITYSGITGHVTDKYTQTPLMAEIKIHGLYGDTTAPRLTDSTYGRFFRLLENGTYKISIHKEDYFSDTISNIKVVSDSLTYLPIELTPKYVPNKKKYQNCVFNFSIYQKGQFINLSNAKDTKSIKIYDLHGRIIFSTILNENQISHSITLPKSISSGSYILKINKNNKNLYMKLILEM